MKEAVGRLGNVWDLCGRGFMLGRTNVCVRGGLEAPGSRVPNPVRFFCLQKIWGYWARQGSDRKVGVVGLVMLNWSR